MFVFGFFATAAIDALSKVARTVSPVPSALIDFSFDGLSWETNRMAFCGRNPAVLPVEEVVVPEVVVPVVLVVVAVEPVVVVVEPVVVPVVVPEVEVPVVDVLDVVDPVVEVAVPDVDEPEDEVPVVLVPPGLAPPPPQPIMIAKNTIVSIPREVWFGRFM